MIIIMIVALIRNSHPGVVQLAKRESMITLLGRTYSGRISGDSTSALSFYFFILFPGHYFYTVLLHWYLLTLMHISVEQVHVLSIA